MRAGGFHTLNGDPNVAMLQSYTVGLYKELEEISGQSCGLHLSAGIMLADTPERMEFLKTTVAKGRYLGMDTGIISVSEAKNYFPFIEEQHFIGALLDPNEGHLDPSGTTYAYAKAARAWRRHHRGSDQGREPGAKTGRHLARHHQQGRRRM